MKIKRVDATEKELSSTLDLKQELSGLSRKDKRDALNEIGSYLVEQTLLNISSSNSPVRGETIKALTDKNYKALKKDEVGHTRANLELTGSMLDSVDYKLVSENELKIGVFGKDAPKADGHNNFSGKSLLPKRRIFPAKDQEYKGPIAKEILAIIADKKASEDIVSKSELKDVASKSEFFSIMKEKLGLDSIAETRLAILRSRDLLSLVESLGLDEYL